MSLDRECRTDRSACRSPAVERVLFTLTTVALFVGVVGVSANAAHAASSPLSSCARRSTRSAAVTSPRKEQPRPSTREVHGLDQQLERSRQTRGGAPAAWPRLRPSSSTRTAPKASRVLLDTTNAMESARRAELISTRERPHAGAPRRVRERGGHAVARAAAASNAPRAAQALSSPPSPSRSRPGARARPGAAGLPRRAPGPGARHVVSTTPTTTASGQSNPVQPAPDRRSRRRRAGFRRPPPPPPSGVNPHHDDPFLVCTRTRESSGQLRRGELRPATTARTSSRSRRGTSRRTTRAMPQLIGVRPDRGVAVGSGPARWVLLPVAGQRALGRSLLAGTLPV